MNCERVLSGEFIADGVPGYIDFPVGCQKGGHHKLIHKKNKSVKKNNANMKHNKSVKKNNANMKMKMKMKMKDKSVKKNNANMKMKIKDKSVTKKNVDVIIENICKSMKRKCTPKYKKILRKLVVKNM